MVSGAIACASIFAPRLATGQTAAKASVRLNWTWLGSYAPLALGVERGFYKDAGIDLTIGQGRGSGTTVRMVGNKADTFAWADTGSAVVSAAQGVPVRQIMTFTRNSLCAIWIDGRTQFSSARDLLGKRIAITAGDGPHQLWPAILAANNINPDQVNVIYLDATAKIAALRDQRVDIVLGGATDQPVALQVLGIPARYMLFSDLGVRTLGHGISTHVDLIKNQPGFVRDFVKATQKSWLASIADPAAACRALERSVESETALNPKIIRGALDVMIATITGAQPFGLTEPSEFEETVEVLKKYGNLNTDQAAAAFYTNEFIGTA